MVYCNVPAFKEWPKNFKLLFQDILTYNYVTVSVKTILNGTFGIS